MPSTNPKSTSGKVPDVENKLNGSLSPTERSRTIEWLDFLFNHVGAPARAIIISMREDLENGEEVSHG